MRDRASAARQREVVGLASTISGVTARHAVKTILSAAIMAVGCIFASAPAQAHGRLGAAEGRCKLFIGPDVMNFTGYLPEASKNEFCEDIPATGPMIMVLDAEQQELRDMNIEVRIVKDVGGEAQENENLDAVTVAHSTPKIYRTGTVNFEHTFDEPGYFVGIVTVTGEHGESWKSRFPFSVGKTFMRDLPVYLTLASGVIAAFVIYLVHQRRLPPPALVTAAAAFKPPPRFDPPTPPTGGNSPSDEAVAGGEGVDPPDEGSAAKPDVAPDENYKREAAE